MKGKLYTDLTRNSSKRKQKLSTLYKKIVSPCVKLLPEQSKIVLRGKARGVNRSTSHCTCSAETSCLYVRKNTPGCIWKGKSLGYRENAPRYPGIICYCPGRTTSILGTALCIHSFIKSKQFKLPQVSTLPYANPWKRARGVLVACTAVPPTDERMPREPATRALHCKAGGLTFDKQVAHIFPDRSCQ